MKSARARQMKIGSPMDINHIAGLKEHIVPAEQPAGAEPLHFASARYGDTQWVPSTNVIRFDERAGESQIFIPQNYRVSHIATDPHHLGHRRLHCGRVNIDGRRRSRRGLFGFAADRRDQQNHCH